MDEQTVELKSLVGNHKLSGVDMINRQLDTGWGSLEDCQCINFVLDGVTYTAIENPSDGYRSMLEKIIISDDKVTNTFSPVDVLVSHIEVISVEYYPGECDIIEFTDTANGKIVLRIGTDNVDDYYPGFIAEWTPENLSVNEGK